MRNQHLLLLLLLRQVALPPIGRPGRGAAPTPPSFSLSVPAPTDGASSLLPFFKPSSASLPLPLHFLCLLPFNFPALALPFSRRPPLRPSLALFLHSFHAALGLPKRLGLNGENLLWYNEPAERGDERERRQRGRGAVGGRVGTDGGMQMHERGGGGEEEEEGGEILKIE